jgi:ribose transport system substrate-binding protein
MNMDRKRRVFMKKTCITVFLILMMISSFSVFASGQKEGKDQPMVIGVTLMSLRHPFFQEMKVGFEARAAELGVVLRLTDADFDAAIQSNQVNDYIQQKVNGLIITPTDSKALAPSVQKAIEAGIPVVTVDVAAQGVAVVSHVASDNIQGGRIAAGLMVGALKKRNINEGVVIIVDHAGVTSTQDRNKGFREVMGNEMPGMTVEALDAVGQRDKAMNVTEDAIQRFGSDLVGIFGVNDDTSLGALSAVERADKNDSISIVGYDAGPESIAAIVAGKIVGDTIQLPAKMGEIALDTLINYINGTEPNPPAFIPVPVGTYTKDGAQVN